MKSLSKFLLSFLLISSFILTPLSNQNTQAFSFSSLFDGDTYGDWLGEGDGGGSGTVNAQNCLTKSLSELEEAYKQNKGKAFAHATGHASVSQSEEDKKKAEEAIKKKKEKLEKEKETKDKENKEEK